MKICRLGFDFAGLGFRGIANERVLDTSDTAWLALCAQSTGASGFDDTLEILEDKSDFDSNEEALDTYVDTWPDDSLFIHSPDTLDSHCELRFQRTRMYS